MTASPLEIEYHGRTAVRTLVELGLITAAYAVVWALDVVPDWLGVGGVAFFGGVLLFALLTMRRAGRRQPAALLDEHGLTMVGAPAVPWSSLRSVVVSPMRPIWLVGSGRLQVVCFLPQPGVELPGPPQPRGRPQSWGRRLRLRLYGTNLVLLSSMTTVDGLQIADAAHELGGLPVRHVRYRTLRRWLVMTVGALLLGLVIGVVAHLVG